MVEDDKYWILLSRYISGELSSEETETLFIWINADSDRIVLLEDLKSAWDKSETYQKNNTESIDVDKAWLKIKGKLSQDTQPVKVIKFQKFKWLSIAASLMIFCLIGYYSFQSYDQNKVIAIVNTTESKRQIQLPDGSTIWLNKGSELKYKKGLANLKNRDVSLIGEAFFEVKHDVQKPFIIHTGQVETQVLGTSFNVKSDRNGVVKVAVISGKVSFRKAKQEGIFLLPGEVGDYLPSKGISKSAFKNTNFLYWKDRTLTFENERLGFVLSEIERSYKIKFKTDDENLLNKKITTSFKAASINEVLIVLENLLDLKITPNGDTYIVVK